MNDDVSDRKLNVKGYLQKQLQYQDWYIRLKEYLKKKIFPITTDPEIKRARQLFYETVEAMLNAGKIPLAEKGPDFDAERKPIDALIIHHTSEDPDIRLSKLSAIGFVRQYGSNYLGGEIRGYEVKGKPVWSGHFREGKMVFFAYHWLVRQNGKAEKLLDDGYIGWQSGDWDINTRSAAIALSGDYTDSVPSEKQIAAIRKIISDNYSSVDESRIFGHREINPKTTCPGNKFLAEPGWKKSITKI